MPSSPDTALPPGKTVDSPRGKRPQTHRLTTVPPSGNGHSPGAELRAVSQGGSVQLAAGRYWLQGGEAPGLYRHEHGKAPRPLLTGELAVLEAGASDTDRAASLIRLEVRHPVSRRRYRLEVTQRRAADLTAWGPLFGSGLIFPERKAEGEQLWGALSDLAAHQAETDGLTISRLVGELAWHETPEGAVWVAPDGLIGPGGIERPGRLRAGVLPEGAPQQLPKLSAPELAAALDRTPEAIAALLEFYGPDEAPIGAALLGLCARVSMRATPADERPGSLREQLEVAGRSGGFKTAGINAALRLFFGAGYHYTTPTQLSEKTEANGGDTGIGRGGLRAGLAFHAYQDFDHRARPSEPRAFERQQRNRLAMLAADGDQAQGGTIGKLEGGIRQRPAPAGLVIRSLEEDPHSFSVQVAGAEGADWRAMTFKLRMPRAQAREWRLSRSRRLFGELAPTLDALRVAWVAWQAQHAPEGWAALVAEQRERVARVIGAIVEGPLVQDWRLVHDRTREQLADAILGLSVYAAFLQDIGAEPAAAACLEQCGPLVIDRARASVELARQYEETAIVAAPDPVEVGLGLLGAALRSGAAYVDALQSTGAGPDAAVTSGHLPAAPAAWGWLGGDLERLQARGPRIGHLDEDRGQVLLIGEEAWRVLRRHHRDTYGQEPAIGEGRFWRELDRRGLLAETGRDAGRETLKARRRLDGGRPSFYVLSVDALKGEPGAPDPPDPPDPPPSDQGGLPDELGQVALALPDPPDPAPAEPGSGGSGAERPPDPAPEGAAPPLSSESSPLGQVGQVGQVPQRALIAGGAVGARFRDVRDWQAQWAGPAEPGSPRQSPQGPPGAPEPAGRTDGPPEPERSAEGLQEPAAARSRQRRFPAVLEAAGLRLPDGRLEPVPDRSSAAAIAPLAASLDVRDVWLLASETARLGLEPAREYRDGEPSPFLAPAAGWRSTPDRLTEMVVCHPPEGRRVVRFQLVNDGAGSRLESLAEVTEGAELLRLVLRLEALIGSRWDGSGSQTAAHLRRQLVREHRGMSPGAYDPAQLPEPLRRGAVREPGWFRPLEPAEVERFPYVVRLDKRAAYLAAMSSDLPAKAPEHVGARPLPELGRAGWALVQVSPWADPLTYDPLAGMRRKADEGGAFWADLHSLRYAARLGLGVEVLDAWTFGEARRFLEQLQRRLRAALEGLSAPGLERRTLRPLVRAMYSELHGWLRSDFHQAGDPLWRPDWADAISSNVLVSLHRLAGRAPGRVVAALGIDSLGVLTVAQEPAAAELEAAELLGVRLGERLGDFHAQGGWPSRLHMVDEADRQEPTRAIARARRDWLRKTGGE
jgi:hypothetical protein